MAIRPPVQVRHKHAMASVAHVQLAQRAVSQTPSGKETLRKKRLGKIRRGTRKRDRSISSSDGEVKDEKRDTLSRDQMLMIFFQTVDAKLNNNKKALQRRYGREGVGNRGRQIF